MAIKLLIKAPDQNFEDHAVDCELSWSVLQLKNHLAEHYPSKPAANKQKLIYSGQLLKDHQHLNDILRQDDEGSNVYILHLVCNLSTIQDQKVRYSNHWNHQHWSRILMEADFEAMPRSSPPVPPPNPVYDEYRRRQEMVIQSVQAVVNSATLPVLSPDAQMAEVAAMQQMYAYYLTQYMQSGSLNQSAALPGNSTQAVVRDYRQPVNQRNQIPRLEENEEINHRDWLEHIFLCCRFLMLFCFVYFYSTPERLMIVTVCAVLAFLYHEGWFMRRGNPVEAHLMAGNHQNANPGPEFDPLLVNQELNQAEEFHDEHELEATMDGDNPPHANHSNAPNNNNNNHLQLYLSFVSSFFTSLIPEPPPPVNIN